MVVENSTFIYLNVILISRFNYIDYVIKSCSQRYDTL